MRTQTSLRRTFLFLQGPHGLFFPRLARSLASSGHRVLRINFNGGDRATWPDGTNFSGSHTGWSRYVRAYLLREGVTDLVLFGDARPHHADAVRIAKQLDVRVHVFEEGYVRPDWVTLERGGVNGYSTLPRDIEWYLKQAESLDAVPENPAIPLYRTARGWAAFFYYAEAVLQHWRFPWHGSHRNRNPVWEGITFLRRFRKRADEEERTLRDAGRLVGARFFLFPLQLDSDYQIRVHSRFGGMRAAIELVIESFARHAPAQTMLAVKEHPLDSGLKNWRAVVEEIAGQWGLRDRVVFFEHGDLSRLVEASQGMVTVNSTSGTLALAAGKPVKTLGAAVYDLPSITHRGSLDDFWTSPVPPDAAAYDAFYRVLADRCLIHGAFLSHTGMAKLVQTATGRLTCDDVIDQIVVVA